MSSGAPVIVRADGFVQIAQFPACPVAPPNPSDEISLAAGWMGASQNSKAQKIPVHLFLSVLII